MFSHLRKVGRFRYVASHFRFSPTSHFLFPVYPFGVGFFCFVSILLWVVVVVVVVLLLLFPWALGHAHYYH